MNLSDSDEIMEKIDRTKIILTQQHVPEALKIAKMLKLGLDLEDIFELALEIDT